MEKNLINKNFLLLKINIKTCFYVFKLKKKLFWVQIDGQTCIFKKIKAHGLIIRFHHVKHRYKELVIIRKEKKGLISALAIKWETNLLQKHKIWNLSTIKAEGIKISRDVR